MTLKQFRLCALTKPEHRKLPRRRTNPPLPLPGKTLAQLKKRAHQTKAVVSALLITLTFSQMESANKKLNLRLKV